MSIKWLTFSACLIVSGLVFASTVHPPAVVLVNGQVLMFEDTMIRLLEELGTNAKILRDGKSITIEEQSQSGLWSEISQAYFNSKKSGWRTFSCKPKELKNLFGIHVDGKGVISTFLLCD